MRRTDLRSIVTALADRVRSPLLLEDARQRSVAYSPQYQAVDELRKEAILTGSLSPEIMAWSDSFGIRTSAGPVRTPADPARGILPRVCVPVRHAGILLGFIWAIDPDERLGEAELAILVEEAGAIAAILYREQLAAELGGELLRGLLSSSARVRAGYASDPGLAEVLPSGARATIVVARGVDPADVELVLRQRATWTLHTVTIDEVVVLVPVGAGAAGPARNVAEAIVARAPAAVAGISEVHATHTSLHLAYREAADAARVARVVPSMGRVAEWARLGAYRLLVRAIADEAGSAALIDPRLAPVLANPELLQTLETYLETAGSAAESAERLGIHRATLYHRLARIETLTGGRLDSGEDRLAFHVGIRLHRLTRSADPTNVERTAVIPRQA
ncbi:MAG: helix-turn-helix domain-containing protein [Chloroflexota bacterium]